MMSHHSASPKGFRLFRCLLLFVWLNVAGCGGQVITPITETVRSPETEVATIQRPAPTLTATSVPSSQPAETTTPPLVSQIQGRLAVLVAEDPVHSSRIDIYVIDIDTGAITRLTENAGVTSFSWSPDGQRIAFSSFESNKSSYQIFIANIDGSGIQRLDLDYLVGGAHRDDVSWSPNGDRLAFVQRVADDGRLHTVNVDGTNVQFLAEGNSPSWSPDGQSLVFIRRNREGHIYGDIFRVGADGRNLHQLTNDIRANWPRWSPDGRRIVFSGYLPDGTNAGIYMINADGSGLEFLHTPDSLPSWSPDGSQILFTEKGRVYTMDVESLQIAPVAGLPPNLYYTFVLPQPK